MKQILTLHYVWFFLAGLLSLLLCAWFSIGFHHPDEHFQILEFANYKMGNSPATDLPWEFNYKMRATVLPCVVFFLTKLLSTVSINNPFIVAFILRLLTGIASWFITCKLFLLLSKKIKSPQAIKLFVLMLFFLWFMPYLNVRFSSENISGLLLLYAIYFVLKATENNRETVLAFIIAGLLFGFSFFIRIQVVLAMLGFVAWLILIKKINWKYIFILSISAIIAIGINTLMDSWFYNGLVFTPFNYFYFNIIQHKAEDFGSSPWWYYFSEFIIKAAPPISIILLIAFLAGIWKNLKDPLVWAILPFIIIHIIISHKELRFLIPVMLPFIFICALGMDYFFTIPAYSQLHKYIVALVVLMNIPLFLFRTFIPAESNVAYYKFLYETGSKESTIIFDSEKDPAQDFYGLPINFYISPRIKTIHSKNTAGIIDYLTAHPCPSFLYFSKSKLEFQDEIPGYKKTRAFTSYPDWVLKFNFNHWEERSGVWSIYKFTKEQ